MQPAFWAGIADAGCAFCAPCAMALNWASVTMRAINRNSFFMLAFSKSDRFVTGAWRRVTQVWQSIPQDNGRQAQGFCKDFEKFTQLQGRFDVPPDSLRRRRPGRVSGRFGSTSCILGCAPPPVAFEELHELQQTVSDDEADTDGNEVNSHWRVVVEQGLSWHGFE